MRSIISTVILFSFGFCANADVVTQKMAQEAAQAFLLNEQSVPPQFARKIKGESTFNNQAAGLVLGEIKPITGGHGEILAYVQELEPQGFIITSADDCMRPVLGFSFTSKFLIDDNRVNPLLDLVIADVAARKRLGSVGNAELAEHAYTIQWGPYIQTTWFQGGIYRSKCPYLDPANPGDRRPTGCTAISMAQIMYMHKYPKSIFFSHDNDHYISKAAVRDTGGHIIGYDQIDIDGDASSFEFPTFSDLNASLKQITYDGSEEEISNFCFGTGIKLRMTYGRRGSGAWRPQAYLDEFNYGSAIHSTDWDGVKDDVIQNMKDGLPAQIAIYNSDPSIPGGHSVIVDGYREDGFFHLNYGWGASSPDSISMAWYNIPDMPRYDIVSMVIYDISVYQGWNQIGADQRNSYYAIYPAPIDRPERKWPVNVPANLPISYSYSHLVVGTGGRIYASLGPTILGDIYHPYIAIYDKFGTREKIIEVTHSNVDIPFLCQNSRGEIFFSSGTGGPTASTSKVYRLNAETDYITPIFTHSSPDAGICDRPIKVDRDDYLYFVITPRYSANYTKFYCISRTGTNNWTPYSFPSSAEFHTTIPAIDEERDRVYLNYFEKTEQYKGKSHLIAFQRSNGSVVFDIELPTPLDYASSMAVAPAVSEAGNVYIGAYTSLFAYSSDGTQLWEKSFYPAFANQTPSIGSDGTIYVDYGKIVNGSFRPGYVRALNPENGDTKWEMSLPLDESDHMSEIYAAANGMVVYSYDKDGQNRLGGVKDEGDSYGNTWGMEGGGTIAFGPGRTIYSIPPGHNQSIWALTDKGTYGEPEGKCMDYADNSKPLTPSVISPVHEAVKQDTNNVQLSWACSDPDGHTLKYDVYACAMIEGEEAAFVPIASQLTESSHTLTDLKKGTQYLWSVVATDGQAIAESPVWTFSTEGVATAVKDDGGVAILPKKYELSQNYPNPFNSSTAIRFIIPKTSEVELSIHNIRGQLIRTMINQRINAGVHSVMWDGKDKNGYDVVSGLYIYRLTTEDFQKTNKMLLIK